jgi:HicB family
MTKANYSLRLQPSLKAPAERFALNEGTSLNQFINVAVAEKLSALDTERYFKDRARDASREDFLAFLDSAQDEMPRETPPTPTPPTSQTQPPAHAALPAAPPPRHQGGRAPDSRSGQTG